MEKIPTGITIFKIRASFLFKSPSLLPLIILDGMEVGWKVGCVGCEVGFADGWQDGLEVGCANGMVVGVEVGRKLGCADG